MKKLLILVMACYGLNARSQQTNETRNFVQLYSDSIIYAKEIRLRPDFSGGWSVRADNRRIQETQIKFFNSDDGYFANLRKVDLFNRTSFAERIIAGKINLYQPISFEPVPFEYDYYRFNAVNTRQAYGRLYYNKGVSDVKKVNYVNLSKDMGDNLPAIDLLKGYRRKQITGTMMYIAAGASAILSGITLLSGKEVQTSTGKFGSLPEHTRPNVTTSFILLGASGGLALGGYLIQSSGSRNIEQAIDLYNR